MKTKLLTAFALFLLLQITDIGRADQPHGQPLTSTSTKIFNDDGSRILGVLIVDRSESNGKIRSLFYSGPPELVVSQVAPWTRWHSESELAEVHLSLTSVNAELFSYLSKIKTLDTLRIEDCIFERSAESAMAKLAMLRVLEIDFATDCAISDWSFLRNLTELEKLSVVGEVVNRDFARGFESLSSLKSLEFWIDDQCKAAVLPKLTSLQSIEKIQITRVGSRPGGVILESSNQTGQQSNGSGLFDEHSAACTGAKGR
ncbi:hypothetical protein [Roseimaritima sediminicola]|uniref:hypothetical protein n=1 Tax=Roseimaritima sediminicola TaxID=2662066 RepID=UPI00129851F0|nr:hypothetical protein [Roseimaritima sediminicola]